jgi:hypothetical protein
MKDRPPDVRTSVANPLAEKFSAAGKPERATEMLTAAGATAKPN